jgi:hypothetical protein
MPDTRRWTLDTGHKTLKTINNQQLTIQQFNHYLTAVVGVITNNKKANR